MTEKKCESDQSAHKEQSGQSLNCLPFHHNSSGNSMASQFDLFAKQGGLVGRALDWV